MNNQLSKAIGERINILLAIQDKKQKDLAAALCVADNTISYFVSGRRMPNTEQITKISDFFGVSADYLLCLSDTPTTDKDIKFICDYTGLEEKSVKILNLYKNTKSVRVIEGKLSRTRTPMLLSFKFLNKFIFDFDFAGFYSDFTERKKIIDNYKKEKSNENQNLNHIENLKHKYERDLAINTFVITEKYKKIYEDFCNKNINSGENNGNNP